MEFLYAYPDFLDKVAQPINPENILQRLEDIFWLKMK